MGKKIKKVEKKVGVGGGSLGPPRFGGVTFDPNMDVFFWRKNEGDGVCHTQNSQLRIPKREGGGGG